MGVKIAVIGGGSTYTPELVEGFARAAIACPSTSWCSSTSPPSGSRSSVGSRGGCWHGGLARPAGLTADRDAAIDGADFVLVQLRVGGQAARLLDETLPPRFGIVGQETTGAGGFAKALRTVPVVLSSPSCAAGARTRRLDRRLHQPGRDRHPGPARRRATGRSACATWPSAAAQPGRAVRRDARSGPARARRAQPPDWERAVRVDGVDRLPELLRPGRPRSLARPRPARRAGPRAWRDPLLLPALLLRDRPGRRGAARGHTRAAGRHRHRGAAARPVPRPDADREAGTACRPRRGVLQRGGGAAHRVAPRRRGRRPGRRRAQRRCPPRSARRPSSRSPPGSTATGPHPLPLRPLAPEMRGLVQAVKAYEDLAVAAAISGDRRTALGRWSPIPLVGWHVAEPLLDALLEANRPYLPRFFG